MLADSRTTHLLNVGSAIYSSVRALDCTPLNFLATVCSNQFHLLADSRTVHLVYEGTSDLFLCPTAPASEANGNFVADCDTSFRSQHCPCICVLFFSLLGALVKSRGHGVFEPPYCSVLSSGSDRRDAICQGEAAHASCNAHSVQVLYRPLAFTTSACTCFQVISTCERLSFCIISDSFIRSN